MLDHLDLTQLYGNARLLRSITSFADKRRQDWLSNPLPESFNRKDISLATHHILHYQLFDLLLDSIGYRSNPSRVNVPKVALEQVIPLNLSMVSFSPRV